MRATYKITRQDLTEGHTGHGGILLRMSQAAALVILIAAIGAGFLGMDLWEVVALLFAGLTFLFRVQITSAISFKRFFAEAGQVEASVSEAGVNFQTQKGTTDLLWTAFVRYLETKNLFLLYPQRNLFIMIPKRGFPPEELPAVREVFQQHLADQSAAYGKGAKVKVAIFVGAAAVFVILLAIVLFRGQAQ
jgi:hypothetical protein